MPYIGTTPTKVVSRQSANVYRYTATAGQSVFTGADLDNNVLACNPADMIVHMNGLRLESTDYTATSTSVTLTTAATAGDELTVTSFVTFEVANTYTKTAADSRYVNTTGDTMTGNLGIGTNSTSTELTIGAAGTPQIDLFNTTSADVLANLRAEADVGTGGSLVFQTKRNGNTPVDVIKADSAGRVTMPYQIGFEAYKDDVGNPPAGTIVWNKVRHNTGNAYNTSTGIFTAPVAGQYIFMTNFFSQGGNYSVADILINGSSRVRGEMDTNSGYRSVCPSCVVYMAQGDSALVSAISGFPIHTPSLLASFSGHLIG